MKLLELLRRENEEKDRRDREQDIEELRRRVARVEAQVRVLSSAVHLPVEFKSEDEE